MIFLNTKKILSSGVLIVLMTQLIIGGILLPYKEAEAFAGDWIGGPSQVVQVIQDAIHQTWQKVSGAYDNAMSTIRTFISQHEWLQKILDAAKKYAWDFLRPTLLHMLVDDTVKWIQGGGQPRVVTDWQSFLATAADKAGGQFIEKYLGMGFLCEAFDINLKALLNKPPTFDQAVSCTITDIVDNIQDFYNDFNNGGWKAWISVAETQNNIYGAYLYAMDEKWGVEAAAAEAAKNEGIASAGFLSDKVCLKVFDKNMQQEFEVGGYGYKAEEIPEGYKCTQWENKTPGSTLAHAMNKAVTLDIDWLMSSKEADEYMGAIIDAVINRVIKEGITKLTAPSGGSLGKTGNGINVPPSANVKLPTYADAVMNSGNAKILSGQESLLKENATALSKEYTATINLLSQIEDTQKNLFSISRNILALKNECSLPSDVKIDSSVTTVSGNCATNCPCAETSNRLMSISIPDIGSAQILKTTTTNYKEGFLSGCEVDGEPSVSATIQSQNFLITAQISTLQSEKNFYDGQISKADIAIQDMNNYQIQAESYIKTYDSLPAANRESDAGLKAIESSLWITKNKAISSSQSFLNSSAKEVADLLSDVQKASEATANKNYELQTKRGVINSCEYVQNGTYYKNLCDAKTKEANFNAVFSACATF